ncbi:MAG: hypothetical protein LBD59_11955 [Prevotellaceae bacterium]|jgi:hypothetical protein|nr:hypothetical protein [Prevotellaceae bacterium]
MFVSHFYSFIVALLLSGICIWYAAYDLASKVRQELKREVAETVIVDNYRMDTVTTSDFVAELPQTLYVPKHIDAGFVPLHAVDDPIPFTHIFESDYFLRPPPRTFV